MDILTIFTIILSVLSFVLALTSVVIVIATIKQNNRMLEASTRPYISVYFDYSQMGEPIGYFVIRNFGNSSGKIIALSYNDIVRRQPEDLCKITNILDGMIGNSIAPNQKFLIPIKLTHAPEGTCVFDISYCTSDKTYTEHFEIIVKQYGKLSKSRVAYEKQKSVSYPLQEIAERLM